MNTVRSRLSHYVVDAKSSKFTVQAFATGILSAMGHNPKIGIRSFSGQVDFSAEPAEGGGFRLSMQANSLSVLDDVSDKDRREMERIMNEQVLEVAKYPDIVYEAAFASIDRIDNALYSARLNGNLNFHGITRVQPVTARIAEFGDILRASGDFTLKQTDYGIKPVSVAGGAIKVKDELKFSFEMVARKME